MPSRRVPYSGKKKKEQLKAKRAKKRAKAEEEASGRGSESVAMTDDNAAERGDAQEVLTASSSKRRTALDSQFVRETDEEFAAAQADAQQPLRLERRASPWADVVDVEVSNDAQLDIPRRPMPIKASKEQLLLEEKLFGAWKMKLAEVFKDRLNYYELNLDVWRQLWRTIERSHMVAIVTDCRFPLFHFPTALYRQLRSLKKPIILVLNKADLVPDAVLDEWEEFFTKQFEDVHVLRYASFITSHDALDANKKRRLAKGTRHYNGGDGRTKFLKLVRELAPKCIEPVWDFEDEQEHRSTAQQQNENIHVGLVGHPNVGKSSFINGIVCQKVVSTSATPGHTKHLQTIDLHDKKDTDLSEGDEKVSAEGITLIDSPGLVFPALDRTRASQTLCGLYPIAQARSPFPALRLLAEACPLEEIYGLTLDKDTPPTPLSLCATLADKRKFYVDRAGRPDARRAAIQILKDSRDGRIVIVWPPPKSTNKVDGAVRVDPSLRDDIVDEDGLVDGMDKLHLSDESDDDSSTNAVEGATVQKEKAPLTRAVSRQTGYQSDDKRFDEETDDAEQALDSGGSSAGVEGDRRRRRRMRRRRKAGLGMAEYYRKQEDQKDRKKSEPVLEFSNDDAVDVGQAAVVADSSDDEVDDYSELASTDKVKKAGATRRRKVLRKTTLTAADVDAGSAAMMEGPSAETDSAEEAEVAS